LRAARAKVGGARELLVVSGDHPRLSSRLLERLVTEHRSSGATATVLSFEPSDPRAYGRIIRDGDGRLEGIVEYADTDERQRAVREVNSSIYVFEAEKLWPALDRIEPVSTVHPFTVLRGKTRVGAGAEVGPHVVAVDAEIGIDVKVGPFCYLRPGTKLAAGSKAGTFVEIKNSEIGARTKIPHLSYIGDAEIGEDTNVAAGNITANYPHQAGLPKGKTKIGRNV